MADLTITFSIEGETQLLRRLEGVSQDLKDWTPQFTKIGKLLLKTFKDNFNSEGQALGEPWAPLKASTLKEKARLGYPSDILVRTGTMKKSFISSPSQFEVVISNPTPYFVYHQSRRPRQHLPRRVLMKIDDRRKQEIIKIIQSSVQNVLQKRQFNVAR